MDTPNFHDLHDSGCVSSSFEVSKRLFESTPKAENESTPVSINPRKRKANYSEGVSGRRLCDVLESPPSTPQFSSTLNESLAKNLAKCHVIEQSYYELPDDEHHYRKLYKDNDNNRKIRSTPSTPENQVGTREETVRKANTSLIKSFSAISVRSPLKEQRDILYPTLKPLDPVKKPLTPQKLREKLDKSFSPAKKRLFALPRRRLLDQIVTNSIVMSRIFGYLSNGDLFRLSHVSGALKRALEANPRAYLRYSSYVALHKTNKENYKITPPSSPENQDFSNGSTSPNSRNFKEFCQLSTSLTKYQTLTKCRRCGKPSVVEHDIAQCQDLQACGYIVCQKCDSFAYRPENFTDKCHNSMLVTHNNNNNHDQSNCRVPRMRLGDLSNASTVNDSPMGGSMNASSGYFSGCDSTHTPNTVKRNLSKSFDVNVLNERNRLQRCATNVSKRRSSVVPVVRSDRPTTTTKKCEVMEPSSPPKIKQCAVGSKQSKRNLKRLTR